MPFKEEDISYSPYVKLYHDFIYDNEIRIALNLAKNNVS